MKILSVHNGYLQRGGEDVVAAAEVELLRSRGHDVLEYHRSNSEVARLSATRTVVDALWSKQTVADVGELLRRERPALIHAHNTFPLISPSIYWAAADAGVPVVQTLHNFRLMCPQAMLLRNGKVCESCVGTWPLPGVIHGCYQGSSAKTALVAGMLLLHRALGTWRHKVSRYIALSEFCRAQFIAGGLLPHQVAVKPNFVDMVAPQPGPRQGLLYVGRLSQEKGIAVLAEAARALRHGSLRVAGSGPDQAVMERAEGVLTLGALDAAAVRGEMCNAIALVMPSLWFENFPRTLVEAYACGLPVVASRLGAMAELVEDGVTGLLAQPGDATDLAAKMQWALDHPQEMAKMGQQARSRYELLYTAEVNYGQLMAIYQDALAAGPP